MNFFKSGGWLYLGVHNFFSVKLETKSLQLQSTTSKALQECAKISRFSQVGCQVHIGPKFQISIFVAGKATSEEIVQKIKIIVVFLRFPEILRSIRKLLDNYTVSYMGSEWIRRVYDPAEIYAPICSQEEASVKRLVVSIRWNRVVDRRPELKDSLVEFQRVLKKRVSHTRIIDFSSLKRDSKARRWTRNDRLTQQ